MNLQEPELKLRDEMAIRTELTRIKSRNANKLLVAEDVVEAARNPKNPLHGEFEWDTDKAAMQYRLSQARAIIRHITVMPEGETESKIPKYISLRSDRKKPGGGYRETSEVIRSKDLMAEMEDTAKKDLDGVLRRFEMLKGFCERVRAAAGIDDNGKSKKK